MLSPGLIADKWHLAIVRKWLGDVILRNLAVTLMQVKRAANVSRPLPFLDLSNINVSAHFKRPLTVSVDSPKLAS